MWWARSEPVAQAWLGAGRAVWFPAGQPGVVADLASSDEGFEQFGQWHAQMGGKTPVRVWLGGDLCRLSSVPSIQGVRRPEDAQDAALAWMQAQGLLQPGWTMRLAESVPGASLWRVALSADGLADRLQGTFRDKVVSVRPWWSWAMQQHKAADTTLCAFDGAALTLCRRDASGAVLSAETVAPIEDLTAARRLLKRRALEEGSPSLHTARIDWTCGEPLAAGDTDFALGPWVRFGDEL